MEKPVFEELFEVNVNAHFENKNGLSYLSCPYAWAAVKKRFPDANYKIHQFGEAHLPYVFEEGVGYMVFTEVTIDGMSHMMWLPVMEGANKEMKSSANFTKFILIRSAPRPVGESGVLTNRKRHRAMRSAKMFLNEKR